jgi:hypothetical protein
VAFQRGLLAKELFLHERGTRTHPLPLLLLCSLGTIVRVVTAAISEQVEAARVFFVLVHCLLAQRSILGRQTRSTTSGCSDVEHGQLIHGIHGFLVVDTHSSGDAPFSFDVAP